MSSASQKPAAIPTGVDLDELVKSSDMGGRNAGKPVERLLAFLAITWSLFQLWYASPLPFAFGVGILSDGEARAVHLTYAMLLAFIAYPALSSSPTHKVPWYDWAAALVAMLAVLYLVVFYRDIAARPGQPTPMDIAASVAGLLLLLEASRRAEGPWMPATCIAMLLYVFCGPLLPELISHKGASVSRAASQFWLTSEGVFGVALGVSTSFIFLFVLFGSLLDRAGAGNYFIQLAFSLLGTFRGGPAKAGVVSSGLTGMISGSSVANVVTTGTFTIPLMKRVGFHPVQAGAIECAAGVNGQLMPPVMGAAAFIMAEYVGIPYSEVVKHAFLPAIMTYGALFLIVDIEAVKAGMKGLPRAVSSYAGNTWLRSLRTMAGFIVLCGLIYYGLGWTRSFMGASAGWFMLALATVLYFWLTAIAARSPDLPEDDLTTELVQVPDFYVVARTGLHYLMPVSVLIWSLMVEEMSPGLSAFWGCIAMGLLVVTHRPLIAFFRGERALGVHWRSGFIALVQGLEAGGRTMAAVGIATAAAGIIVGTVTLTGLGLVMAEIVEFLSAGNFMAMLVLVALICIVLGTGLPTTASYVVVATLMAPVMVEIASLNDLDVPLIAVHMFVFYFGLMADVSPPVGLAAYAAGAIAGADPMKVGWKATIYEARTALLPFIFIFNTEILMIDINGWMHFVMVVLAACLAMWAFVAASQRWLVTECRWYEVLILLLVCFTLFRPGFWLDQFYARYELRSPAEVAAAADQTPAGGPLRLRFEAQDRSGDNVERVVRLNLGSGATGAERIRSTGMTLFARGDNVVVQGVRLGSQAARLGVQQGDVVLGMMVPADRPSPYWFLIPGFALFGLVYGLQSRRKNPLTTFGKTA